MAAVRAILVGGKRAARDDGGAEQPEKVGAHLSCRELFRITAATGQVDGAEPVRRDVLKRAGLLPPDVELGRRGSRSRALRRRVEKNGQAFRIGVGQGLQQDRVDDREDRRIGPDAERQCRDRRDGEPWILPHHPH